MDTAPGLVNVQLDWWGRDSIRIRISPDDIHPVPYVQALLPSPPVPGCVGGSSTSSLQLDNGNLRVEVDNHGVLTATRLIDGAVLLQTTNIVFQEVSLQSIYPPAYSLYSVSLEYTHLNGKIFGLGEHRTGTTAYNNFNWVFENSQTYAISSGADIMLPFYVSTSGFGFLYNEAGYGSISINPNAARWSSNATHQLDLWITTSPAAAKDLTPYPAISSNFADATGHPNPLPSYASGLWQSKDRYRSNDEVLSVARQFQAIPLNVSMLVIDYLHWDWLGDWSFGYGQTCWPNPSSMTSELSSFGIHSMISVWPRLDPHSKHYPDMSRLKYLTTDANGGELSQDGNLLLYDPFIPEARAYLWNALVEGYGQNGIQHYWLDACEPEGVIPGKTWWGGKSELEVGMTWILKHQQMVWDGAQDNNTLMLTRSAWIGSSKYNAVVWSGDLESTWDSFVTQVKLAPNVQLSGLHWWATDIAGYRDGYYEDSGFNELLVRWYQWGVFLPIFRTHGHRQPSADSNQCGPSGGPNELWTYMHQTEIQAMMVLRESIRPYVEEHLLVASITGVPILQPMWYNFSDSECLEDAAETQYMFGPTYLVAPVLQQGVTSVSVYFPRLPPTEQWVHFFSGQSYTAGQRQDVPVVSLGDFPLFQRLRR
jgi:alpha-D-xyloside xylohydrolase